MTTATLAPVHATAPIRTGLIQTFAAREPVFTGAALFLAAMTVPTLAAMALDNRTIEGVGVWMKPLKFEIALSIYLATLAWFAGWLPAGTTARRWYRAFAAIVVTAIALEMLWIGGAAANGVASHFNVSSPLMAAAYSLAGILAVTLTTATLVYAVLIARDPASPLDPAFRRSVVLGLGLTFVLTVAFAGAMSAMGSHAVGNPPAGAGSVPLMGWSRGAGDLRVAHFFATHAMHVLPAVGWIAAMLMPKALRMTSVWLAAAAYTGFVAWTFAEALSGRAFALFAVSAMH